MKKLSDFQALLCLNGNLPEREFFLRAIDEGMVIVAADGGANRLAEIGIVADFVVGDMDSFKNPDNLSVARVVVIEDQNFTDFEKALSFVKSKKLEPILVLGINGGEIDHILNNMNTFVRYADEINMWFYDIPNAGKSKIGRMIKGAMELSIVKEATISLFSFDEGDLQTEGMVWEIDLQSFHVMQKSAARNQAKKDKVKISTTGEKLLTVFDGEF